MCYYLIKNKHSKIQFIFYNKDFNRYIYQYLTQVFTPVKSKYSMLHKQQKKNEVLNVGGYREKEIPSPISNLAVKILIADNTAAFSCGNVGRRQLLRSLFLFMVKIIIIVKFAWLISVLIIYILLF